MDLIDEFLSAVTKEDICDQIGIEPEKATEADIFVVCAADIGDGFTSANTRSKNETVRVDLLIVAATRLVRLAGEEIGLERAEEVFMDAVRTAKFERRQTD